MKHTSEELTAAAQVLIGLARRMAGKTGYNLANDEPVFDDTEFLTLGFAAGVLMTAAAEVEK